MDLVVRVLGSGPRFRSGRSCGVTKWVIELSEFDIIYRSRFAIKGKVLANFIIELSDIVREVL